MAGRRSGATRDDRAREVTLILAASMLLGMALAAGVGALVGAWFT